MIFLELNTNSNVHVHVHVHVISHFLFLNNVRHCVSIVTKIKTHLSLSSTEKDSINGKFEEMDWNSSMLIYPDWSVSYTLNTDCNEGI